MHLALFFTVTSSVRWTAKRWKRWGRTVHYALQMFRPTFSFPNRFCMLTRTTFSKHIQKLLGKKTMQVQES